METNASNVLRRMKGGFTLLELLLVIALIGILSAIGIIGWNRIMRDTAAKEAVVARRALSSAIEGFKTANGGEYPKVIQSYIESGKRGDGKGLSGLKHFSKSETKSIIDELVKESDTGNTLLDATKLKVLANGDVMTYQEAKREHASISYYGYLDGDGEFRPFYLYINPLANNKIGFYYHMESSSDNIEYERKDQQLILYNTSWKEVSVLASEREVFE